MSVFPYSCEKSENGRTRLYLLVPDGSNFVGGRFYVIDKKGHIHQETVIESGNTFAQKLRLFGRIRNKNEKFGQLFAKKFFLILDWIFNMRDFRETATLSICN